MFKPVSCFILAKSGNISHFQGPFTRWTKESGKSIVMPNYKELAVQAIPSFTPSLQLRLCHLPFQPTELCVACKNSNSDSSFVRADANQQYMGKCASLQYLKHFRIKSCPPFMKHVFFFNFPLEEKKCKTTFLLGHWRIMWPQLSCLMD